MFWRETEREDRDQNGGPPCGYVRVLVVGDSGNSVLVPLRVYLKLHCFIGWNLFAVCPCAVI